MKRRFSDGRHLLRFTPRELMLRLCALVPPRRFHMVRYAGIFSAHARGRHALTGRGLRDLPPEPMPPPVATPMNAGVEPPPEVPAPVPPPPTVSAEPTSLRDLDSDLDPAPLAGPDDPTRARRLEWSTLMKRAYPIDVLVCPSCAGPMRLIALIEDERVAKRILAHLGLPARAPPRGRPWRPAQPTWPLDDDAAAAAD